MDRSEAVDTSVLGIAKFLSKVLVKTPQVKRPQMVNGDPASLGASGTKIGNYSRSSVASPTNKGPSVGPTDAKDFKAQRDESHMSRESVRQMCTIFNSIIAKQQ